MRREQLENIYLINGIEDFELRSLGDLMKIHGINARKIEGFSELSEEDKKVYEKFIIRYMNGHGLSYRSTIYPQKIYRAFEVDYLVKEDPNNNFYFKFAGEVWDCTDEDNVVMVKGWGSIEDRNKPGVIKKRGESYLRVEVKEKDSEVWLHIIEGGEQWY